MVMIVAVLPWGAFTAQFPAPAGRAAEATIVSVVGAEKEAEVKSLKASKRCKGPALLGSPCGPQTIISGPDSVVLSLPRVSEARFARTDIRLTGTFEEKALDPPRLG